MPKIEEKEALRNLTKIYEELKFAVGTDMLMKEMQVSDICYDMQMTEEQFVEYLADKSDVGFCVDAAKLLIKNNKRGNFYGKDN